MNEERVKTGERRTGGVGGALTAWGWSLPALLFFWGFSVDDAWIVTRVVDNGLGTGTWSFNRGRPATDAITPWGYAYFIGGLTKLTRLWGDGDALLVARLSGALAWLSVLGVVGARFKSAGTRSHFVLALGLLALVTGHAWASAGLETPWVALFWTLGMLGLESRRAGLEKLGAWGLGAAVMWRPELLPCSLVALGLWGHAPFTRAAVRRSFTLLFFLGVPVLVVALLRWHQFDSFFPLAFTAKAPSFSSGLRYALGGTILIGVPGLLLSLLWKSAWPERAGTVRLRRAAIVMGAHLLALILAGGDWMPFFRLFVPILPWLILVAASEGGARAWSRCRRGGIALLSLSGPLLLTLGLGSDARLVLERRREWIEQARATLEGARVVAAVDVGWVGQTTSASIVDLAGVTDPKIARLVGGHTSKWIAPGLFSAREIDTWIIRAEGREFSPEQPLTELRCVYPVDRRLLRAAEQMGFRATQVIPIDGLEEQYVIAQLPTSSTAMAREANDLK